MKTAFDYKQELDRLTFTQEEKEAMTARLLSAVPGKNTRRQSKGLRRGIVAAVAAAACLTVAAGATGLLKLPSTAFAPVFGAAETEIIDRIGHPVDASATSGGVTITADAVLGDKYHYAVAYTLTKNDGTAFDLPDCRNLLFEDSRSDIATTGGVTGYSYFYDADPADNAIQYAAIYETTEPVAQGTVVRAHFKNLCEAGPAGEAPEQLIRGSWALSFRLNFEDLSTTLALDTPVVLAGHDAVLNDLTISPIGLSLSYTFPEAIPMPEQESGRESAAQEAWTDLVFGSIPMELRQKDGVVLNIQNASGSSETDGQGAMHCTKGVTFDAILPLEDLESITICGVTFPISAS